MDGGLSDKLDDQLHAAETGVTTEKKMLKKWLWIFLTASGLLATAQAQDSQPQATVSPKEVAGQCQVSLVETAHLKMKQFFRNSSMFSSSCDVDFKDKEKVSIGEIGIIFSPRDMDLANNYAVGFERNQDKPEQWFFEGTINILLKSRFLKRSFTHKKEGDEELLVGHQLIRGEMPNGGITELPGIRILRLTPQFVIIVEQDFEPMTSELSVKTYKQRLDTYSRELVEIVKGIQPTPGQSGPTVRANP